MISCKASPDTPKGGHQTPVRWLALALSTIFLLIETSTAASTAFTYQGRLAEGPQAANGAYDFQFRLIDAATNGNTVGSVLQIPQLTVSNGLFSAALDYGFAAFDGSARWLEIGVRRTGSGSNYTILAPRQSIVPTPYAIHAGSSDLSTALVNGGASLTNVPGTGIQPATIGTNQINAAADAAYRATDTNAVQAVGDARWAAKTVINVKDFGAKGNGIDDDTVPLSNAWNNFAALGGILYFPPGTYLDSGTHIASGWRAGEPPFRDGRLVLGQGGVIWKYTGPTTHFVLSNSVPDFEGLEFACAGSGTNCMYVTGAWSKWSMRHCFFNGWLNARIGALVVDEADSVTLSAVQFYQCGMGLGLGYHCGAFQADLLFSDCGTCVAVGVPTPSFPFQRDSQVVKLKLLAAYCGTVLAVDGASGEIVLEANNWYSTNTVVLGSIPGISTNYEGYVGSVSVEHSWFNNGSTLTPPIQLYSPVYPALEIRQSRFDVSSAPVAMVKSWNAGADQTRLAWSDSAVWGTPKGMFEDSSGAVLAESANDQSRLFDKGLGIYSAKSLLNEGGSGYLLDVLDASHAGPVARFGLNSHSGNRFDDFWSGLTVGFNPSMNRGLIQVTNADFVVSAPAPVASANDPGQPGCLRWDTNYLYICVQSNLWKRVPLSSW